MSIPQIISIGNNSVKIEIDEWAFLFQKRNEGNINWVGIERLDKSRLYSPSNLEPPESLIRWARTKAEKYFSSSRDQQLRLPF